MTEHERLLEDFEDARFALLMEGVARKEGERLEALNEMLLENPEAAVPESVDKRCLEAIDRHFARERRRAGLRKTGKVLRLAAVVMAISVILFTTAFALSEDFRVATMNLMLTVTEKYTRFDIRSSEETNRQTSPSGNTASFEYFENAEIGWLPEGFAYTDGVYDQFAMFEAGPDSWISIILESGDASANVDTENPDSIESVTINGNEGLCITKSDYIHIITVDLDNYLYIDVSTSPDLTVDEVKKIVENISIGQSAASTQYFENAEIGWIPEGFEYTERISDSRVIFENEQGEYFEIVLTPGSANVRVDTENPESLEHVIINGNEGLCVVKYGEVSITLADLENNFYIGVYTSSGVSVETAKKIAENITIL